jgi:hypothetical protein
MQKLGEQPEEQSFGLSNGPPAEMERKFQLALCELLNQQEISSGWKWSREEKYKTAALRNNNEISIDLMGTYNGAYRAAIELKYVPTSQKTGKAQDAYAFPYDVLKDCLKTELTATNLCQSKNSLPPVIFGYSIGLTNDTRILTGAIQGWSINYMERLLPDETSAGRSEFSFGPCSIFTVSEVNLQRVIYHPATRRHHIILGSKWTGKWFDFNDKGFKFVMLSSDFTEKTPSYGNIKNDQTYIAEPSRFVPFLTPELRAMALEKGIEIQRTDKKRGA